MAPPLGHAGPLKIQRHHLAPYELIILRSISVFEACTFSFLVIVRDRHGGGPVTVFVPPAPSSNFSELSVVHEDGGVYPHAGRIDNICV